MYGSLRKGRQIRREGKEVKGRARESNDPPCPSKRVSHGDIDCVVIANIKSLIILCTAIADSVLGSAHSLRKLSRPSLNILITY